MFSFLKRIFGGSSVNYRDLVNNGAQIIDVRTPAEFSNGSIRNSINIPLQQLISEMKKLDLKKTCYYLLCKRNAKCLGKGYPPGKRF